MRRSWILRITSLALAGWLAQACAPTPNRAPPSATLPPVTPPGSLGTMLQPRTPSADHFRSDNVTSTVFSTPPRSYVTVTLSPGFAARNSVVNVSTSFSTVSFHLSSRSSF